MQERGLDKMVIESTVNLSFGGNCEPRIGLDDDVLRGSGEEEEVVVVKMVRSIV